MKMIHMAVCILLAAFIPACGSETSSSENNPGNLSDAQGQGYYKIDPTQPGGRNGEIEVIVFFSYDVPDCYDFEPLLKAWVSKLPKDVIFRRVPVIFDHRQWSSLMKLYLTLESMDRAETLSQTVFDAIHVDHVSLYSKEECFAWLIKQGIDLEKFHFFWDSFSMQDRITRCEQLSAAYKVEEVPLIAIDGRYMVLPLANYNENLSKYQCFKAGLKCADELIALIRSGK